MDSYQISLYLEPQYRNNYNQIKMKTYSEADAAPRLQEMSGWSFHNNGIEKEYRFKDFVEAFGFMTRAAIHAEKANHHPEWFNVYNQVKVRLSTHDAGGLTDKDFALAIKFDELLAISN